MSGDRQAAPEGVSKKALPSMRVFTFARSGHPALKNWSAAEWCRWPHIMIDLGTRTKYDPDRRAEQMGMKRKIGAQVPDFGAIAPLLARTNFLSNSFYVALGDAIDLYDLQILRPPLDDLTATVALFWNTGLSREPAINWLRELITQSFEELLRETDSDFSEREVMLPST